MSWRDVAHLEVTALQGHEFGALLEQGAAIIGLEREVAGDRLAELLHHFGANILIGKHGREAKHRLILRESRQRSGGGQERGTDQQRAAGQRIGHWVSSLGPVSGVLYELVRSIRGRTAPFGMAGSVARGR